MADEGLKKRTCCNSYWPRDQHVETCDNYREPIDYRMLKAPFGRPNTTEGIYSIPSHVWIKVSPTLELRHEMGRIAQVKVDGTSITFLTAGEWQMKMFQPLGSSMSKEINANRP